MSTCKKCACEVQTSYCPHCGHPRELQRINGHYVLSEIGSVLNFQKGIFYTIRQLLIKPGKSIREFISEDRNRLVKPVMFILISSLLYTVFVSIFHFKDGYISYNPDNWQNSSVGVIFEWISQNYGYSNMIMAVFVAIWIKVFFRKYDSNFYEILILLCFVIGVGMLMYALAGAIESLTRIRILKYGVYVVLLYTFWAIGQFFDSRKIINYFKALISYVLGLISFVFSAIGVGALIDFLSKG